MVGRWKYQMDSLLQNQGWKDRWKCLPSGQEARWNESFLREQPNSFTRTWFISTSPEPPSGQQKDVVGATTRLAERGRKAAIPPHLSSSRNKGSGAFLCTIALFQNKQILEIQHCLRWFSGKSKHLRHVHTFERRVRRTPAQAEATGMFTAQLFCSCRSQKFRKSIEGAKGRIFFSPRLAEGKESQAHNASVARHTLIIWMGRDVPMPNTKQNKFKNLRRGCDLAKILFLPFSISSPL